MQIPQSVIESTPARASAMLTAAVMSNAGVPARVCGEMAGRPLEAMALIGIGADSFSITPAGVGPVKAMIRSLNAAAVRARLDVLLAKPPRDLRKALTDWARRHKVIID